MNTERIQYLEWWQLPSLQPETTIIISLLLCDETAPSWASQPKNTKINDVPFFSLQGFPMYRKSKHWQRFKLFQHCAKKRKQFSKAMHKKKKNYNNSLIFLAQTVFNQDLSSEAKLPSLYGSKYSRVTEQNAGQLRTSDRSDSVRVSAADVHQTSSRLTGELWGNVLKPVSS